MNVRNLTEKKLHIFCNLKHKQTCGILLESIFLGGIGDLPNPGIEPMSPALQVDSLQS